MARPTKYPDFCTNTAIVDPVSHQNNVAEPALTHKAEGWRREEKPPRQWFNWLFNLYYLWIVFLDEQIIALTSSVSDVTPPGYISGFTHTITENSLTIAPGCALDSTNAIIISSVDAAIGAKVIEVGTGYEYGDGGNGLPAACTPTEFDTLYLFIFRRLNGTVDFGFDTDYTGINLLNDPLIRNPNETIPYYRYLGAANIEHYLTGACFFTHADLPARKVIYDYEKTLVASDFTSLGGGQWETAMLLSPDVSNRVFMDIDAPVTADASGAYFNVGLGSKEHTFSQRISANNFVNGKSILTTTGSSYFVLTTDAVSIPVDLTVHLKYLFSDIIGL